MSGIRKNIFYQSLYEITVLVLPFFTSPYISRIMGAGYLGIYSYTHSIAYYFHLFGMLGIKLYGNRSIAKVRNDKAELDRVFNELFGLHAVVSLCCFAAYLFYCFTISEYKLYALLQSASVLGSLFDVSWLFFGLEKFRTTTLRSILVKLASVACIFIFVKSADDFPIYVLIMAGGNLFNALFLFFLSFREVSYRFPPPSAFRKHIRPLLVLFIPILALSLFKYMDKIMLGALGDKAELGYYENAEKVLNIPLSVVFSFGSVMLPRISNLVAAENRSSVSRYLALSIKYMVGISFAMAFGMAAIAPVFAPVFWGRPFSRSGSLIALLSVSIPFSTAASIVRNQDMIPNGQDKYYSYSVVAGAVVNLVINYLLIPRYQATGVAVGTIAAEIVVCLSELWFVRGSGNYRRMLLAPMEFFIPGLIMFFVVRILGKLLGSHIYTLAVQLAAGVVVFFIAAYFAAFAVKDEETKDLLPRLLRKG